MPGLILHADSDPFVRSFPGLGAHRENPNLCMSKPPTAGIARFSPPRTDTMAAGLSSRSSSSCEASGVGLPRASRERLSRIDTHLIASRLSCLARFVRILPVQSCPRCDALEIVRCAGAGRGLRGRSLAEPVASLKATDYVNDFAGVFSAKTKTELRWNCAASSTKKAGSQIAVVTIKSTDGEEIFNYAVDSLPEVGHRQKRQGPRCSDSASGAGPQVLHQRRLRA